MSALKNDKNSFKNNMIGHMKASAGIICLDPLAHPVLKVFLCSIWCVVRPIPSAWPSKLKTCPMGN